MKKVIRSGAVAALALSVMTAALANTNLEPGSAAPELRVARWVKGTPVTNFEKGKVYVVEFWATWCGPCKQSIPHLTELAKKYAGKATFTGVSVWEKNAPLGSYSNYGDKVAAFAKDWGQKMAYNVAWDGDEKSGEPSMSTEWLKAAGQNGIPSSFIVDQTGKVVWIGHPMDGLDEALGQVIAGTFDVQAEADKEAKARERQEQQMAEMKSYLIPYRSGDYKAAVTAIDKILASDSKKEAGLGVTRYVALSNYDSTAANQYAKKLENEVFKGEPFGLNSLAWEMVDDKGKAKGVDPKLAAEISEKSVALTKDPTNLAYNLDTLSLCYFKAGEVEKAITTEQKALATADSVKGFDAATRKELADRLIQYQAKKA